MRATFKITLIYFDHGNSPVGSQLRAWRVRTWAAGQGSWGPEPGISEPEPGTAEPERGTAEPERGTAEPEPVYRRPPRPGEQQRQTPGER